MTRTVSDPAASNRGARRWLQVLVNSEFDYLLEFVGDVLPVWPREIDWLSPVVSDHYAEYRDQPFVDLLSSSRFLPPALELNRPLAGFWPRFGPQWDGLGVTDKQQVLLLDAKAHISEMATAPDQARGESAVLLIHNSLSETRAFLKARGPVNWSAVFYQYANRLAHLYWLRELNGLDAYLVNIFFLNDREMGSPATPAEWQAGIQLREASLGLRQPLANGFSLNHWVGAYSLNVFIDTDIIPVRYPSPIQSP